MSNDGKHHFHLKEYSILQLLYAYIESDILSVTHILGYNIVTFGGVLHTLLKVKNKGNFFITKKLTRRFSFFWPEGRYILKSLLHQV